jgi:hypothetical protein
MENPFNGMTRNRTERKQIDAGIYQGTLVAVKSIQVTDKKTNEKKTKIIFSYYIPSEDTEVAAFFNPSLADSSWIVKFLKAGLGSAFPSDAQASGDKMWAFVQSLVNKDYNLVVTLNNGYNNVQSAMPIKEKKPLASAPTEDITFAFPDDQIPF